MATETIVSLPNSLMRQLELNTREWDRRDQELKELHEDLVYLGVGIPHGFGENVALCSGLFGDQRYWKTMEGWLTRIKYKPHALPVNNDGTFMTFLSFKNHLARIFEQTKEPSHVIAHSLAGPMIAVIGEDNPEYIKSLIMLGSPATMGALSYASFSTEPDRIAMKFLPRDPKSNVLSGSRITSLYSSEDGIVPSYLSRVNSPYVENIEIPQGSHLGLGVNREVYKHIAYLLREPVS